MTRAVATLGGGCFWCIETVFNRLRGVKSAVSGYMGGHTANPTYETICNGDTGHAFENYLSCGMRLDFNTIPCRLGAID